MKLRCPVCGEEFRVMPSQAKRRLTCSRECRDELMRQRIASGEIAVGRNAWSDETKAAMALSAEVRAMEVQSRKVAAALSVERRITRDARKEAHKELEEKKFERIAKYLVFLGEAHEGESLWDYFKRVDMMGSSETRLRFNAYARKGLWPMSEGWTPPMPEGWTPE